jgi:hypothetical protein
VEIWRDWGARLRACQSTVHSWSLAIVPAKLNHIGVETRSFSPKLYNIESTLRHTLDRQDGMVIVQGGERAQGLHPSEGVLMVLGNDDRLRFGPSMDDPVRDNFDIICGT